MRNEIYPEFLAVLLAAKRTGKAVQWLGTRSETISGDHHGRAADLIGELALDRKGRFLALRVQWLVNLGAYCSNAGPLINTIAAPTSSAISLYDLPAVHGRHRLIFTNTTPTTAYRGAGRPNVAYLWERLVEEAAVAVGIDSDKAAPAKRAAQKDIPDEDADRLHLRQRRSRSGFWTRRSKRPTGTTSRSAARRRSAKESCAASASRCFWSRPAAWARSRSSCAVEPNGRLSMFSLAGPSGQGHETVYPALVAEILGFSDDKIDLRYNDVRCSKTDRHRHLRIAVADQPRRRADEGRQGNCREGQGSRRPPVRGRGR